MQALSKIFSLKEGYILQKFPKIITHFLDFERNGRAFRKNRRTHHRIVNKMKITFQLLHKTLPRFGPTFVVEKQQPPQNWGYII